MHPEPVEGRPRRRAADELGVEDPEGEFKRWLEEEGSVGKGAGA